MMHALLAILGVIVSFIVGFYFGARRGYSVGYDDADANHDFDRCPHCKKFLVDDDDDGSDPDAT